MVIAQAGQLRFGKPPLALTNGGTNAIWDIEGEVDVRNTGMVELGALVGSLAASSALTHRLSAGRARLSSAS